MTEPDCTREEFEAWCDNLANLLMNHEPRVCDSVGCDLDGRHLEITLYGQQANRLLLQLTLLGDYKALTEATRRRSQDPEFIARLRSNSERYRELLILLAEDDGDAPKDP